MFIDRVVIHVQGGHGGRGCVSFRREKFVPRGGPDGGDGGKGGTVWITAQSGLDNLAHLMNRKFWHAQNGKPGSGANKHGGDGDDIVIQVPPGTIVKDRDRGNVLRDLREPGDQVPVARGGKGGKGNKQFATPTHQAPREFEPGQEGESRWIVLELKLIADVGLLGMPNAGKSTLLSRISRAQPEIADYPFTTKHPNVGMVQVDADHSLVVADIPGLIEGAHQGAGLGHEFLRHVERTRVLVHLVEILPSDRSDPADNYRKIRRELELYNPALADRPEVVLLTKLDLTSEPGDVVGEFASRVDRPVIGISAVTGRGLAEMVRRVYELVRQSPEHEPTGAGTPPMPSEPTPDDQ